MTIGIPPWISDYGAVSFAALFGSLANGSRWKNETGQFERARILTETATAVALSIGIMAAGEYSHGILDLKILAGLGVIGGWLGPKPVADYALRKFGFIKPEDKP